LARITLGAEDQVHIPLERNLFLHLPELSGCVSILGILLIGMKALCSLPCFVFPALAEQPAWRVRQEEHAYKEDQRPNGLDRERKSPLER
jgi:hypothetical protein